MNADLNLTPEPPVPDMNELATKPTLDADTWAYLHALLAYKNRAPDAPANPEWEAAATHMQYACRVKMLLLDRTKTGFYQSHSEHSSEQATLLRDRIAQSVNRVLSVLGVPKLGIFDERVTQLVQAAVGTESLDEYRRLLEWVQSFRQGTLGLEPALQRIVLWHVPELTATHANGTPIFHVSLRKFMAIRIVGFCTRNGLTPKEGTLAEYLDYLTPEKMSEFIEPPHIGDFVVPERRAWVNDVLKTDYSSSGGFPAVTLNI